MNELFKINDYELLSRKVYRILKDRIIKEEFKQGGKLLEKNIAEQLGVSRTPVREALRELAAEGFVEITPNQGIILNNVSFEEIWDILQIRGVLEGMAAKITAKKLSTDKIEKFNKIIDQMKYYVSNNSNSKEDILRFSKLDSEFHNLILSICGNRWLTQILHNLKNHIEKYRIRSFSIPGTFSKSLKEHCKILDVMKKGDSELAEKLSRIHMGNAYKNISIYETTKKVGGNKKYF